MPHEPDWERIFAGKPYHVRGLSAREIVAIRKPIPLPRLDSEWQPKPGERYSVGPGDKRYRDDGVAYWWHVGADERAWDTRFQKEVAAPLPTQKTQQNFQDDGRYGKG